MSNRNRWNAWYHTLDADDPQPYGDSDSYRILADWVADCDLVEDWGCGKGWMQNFILPGRYRGIDGSRTPFADQQTDLCLYRSDVDGIVIRHVLEHDPHWADILTNAVMSFRRRLGIAIFTPMQDVTQVIDTTAIVDVPDIGFAHDDIIAHFEPGTWRRIDLANSPTKYGLEHIYLVEKGTS